MQMMMSHDAKYGQRYDPSKSLRQHILRTMQGKQLVQTDHI